MSGPGARHCQVLVVAVLANLWIPREVRANLDAIVADSEKDSSSKRNTRTEVHVAASVVCRVACSSGGECSRASAGGSRTPATTNAFTTTSEIGEMTISSRQNQPAETRQGRASGRMMMSAAGDARVSPSGTSPVVATMK